MLRKSNFLNSMTARLISFVMAVSIAFSAIAITAHTQAAAHASEKAFTIESVDLSNSSFDEDGSSSLLSTPSSWTGKTLEENGTKGSTIDGAVNLSKYNDPSATEDELKLREYKENRIVPHRSPASDDSYVLMVNSNGSEVAYGYTSNTFSLSANSYYRISVWALTGDFTSKGASIRLSGLKNDLVFDDINTHTYLRNNNYSGEDFSEINSNKDFDYGWVKYSFYVETSTMLDSSVSLTLGLGDYYEYTDKKGNDNKSSYKSCGYALFDEIEIYQLAPIDFESQISNTLLSTGSENEFLNPDKDGRTYNLDKAGSTMYYSESDAQILSIDDDKNILSEDDANFSAYDVGSFDNKEKGWESIGDAFSGGYLRTGIFNDYNEDLGLKETNGMIPYSPNGNDDNIALISTYDKTRDKFDTLAKGYKTKDFTIDRFKCYRLSVWTKTYGSDESSFVVAGDNYKGKDVSLSPENPNYGKGQLSVTATEKGGDTANTSRNGWAEVAFYIKGSSYAAYDIHFEIWFGYTDAEKSGIAMFDNIRIEEITQSEYRDYSGNGTAVTFDNEESTVNISNGLFNEIEDYDEYAFPFTPRLWTLECAGQDGTTGMSTRVVDDKWEDKIITGIVNSDVSSVTLKPKSVELQSYKSYPLNTNKSDNGKTNLLMIKSPEEEVAVGYKSSSFSIGSSAYKMVSVTLSASIESGYGANIVLKDGNSILSTIEQIDTQGEYKTYYFYVKTGAKSLTEPVIEIWLGLYDKQNNETKLSKGTVLVEKVDCTDMASSEDDDASTEFDAAYVQYAQYPTTCGFGIVDTAEERFLSFNAYDDSFVKETYSYTLTEGTNVEYGIFDGTAVQNEYNKTNAEARDAVIFGSTYNHDGAYGKHALLIKNTTPTYSRIESNVSYSLTDGKYYKFTVAAQINVPTTTNKQKGAYFGITGGDNDDEVILENIKTSAKVLNLAGDIDEQDNGYKEYTIYFRTHGDLADDEDSQNNQTYNMVFGIGGTTIDEQTIGTMLIGSITCTEITNSEFEEAKERIDTFDKSKSYYETYESFAPDEEEEEEEESSDSSSFDMSDAWYVYTSILLVVAILIAGIGYLVKYYAVKRKAAGIDTEKQTASYDRAKTLLKQHNERNKGEEEILVSQFIKDPYDMFDENLEQEIEDTRRELAKAAKAEEKNDEAAEEITEEPSVEEIFDEEPAAEDTLSEETPAAETSETAETSEAPEAEEQKEEENEDLYNEVVDFSVRAKETQAKKAEETAKEEAEQKAKEEENAKKAAEEAEREKQAKKEKRDFDKWDDFDD